LLRARKTAEELNLLRDPTEKIVELTEPILQELAGAKKLHQLRYPTYVVCTHPNFQLRSIEGLVSIKGTALKELNLSDNKLMVLDSLDQFSTLKILKASRNEIFEVVIEKLFFGEGFLNYVVSVFWFNQVIEFHHIYLVVVLFLQISYRGPDIFV
jgi:hypothetical protein